MELGVSHEQSLSSSTPIVDNIFDKYNKNLVPIRSLSDHDTYNTRNKSLPNIQKHTKNLYNTSFMCKALTEYTKALGMH